MAAAVGNGQVDEEAFYGLGQRFAWKLNQALVAIAKECTESSG
jgi:hypothetical protein